VAHILDKSINRGGGAYFTARECAVAGADDADSSIAWESVEEVVMMEMWLVGVSWLWVMMSIPSGTFPVFLSSRRLSWPSAVEALVLRQKITNSVDNRTIRVST
jgi:hypothetical protein